MCGRGNGSFGVERERCRGSAARVGECVPYQVSNKYKSNFKTRYYPSKAEASERVIANKGLAGDVEFANGTIRLPSSVQSI